MGQAVTLTVTVAQPPPALQSRSRQPGGPGAPVPP